MKNSAILEYAACYPIRVTRFKHYSPFLLHCVSYRWKDLPHAQVAVQATAEIVLFQNPIIKCVIIAIEWMYIYLLYIVMRER